MRRDRLWLNPARNKFEGGGESCWLLPAACAGPRAVSTMPSPALHLRAPLLWVLVPFMTGLTLARVWPAPGFGLGPLV